LSLSHYHFGSTGSLQSQTDEHGNSLVYSYDGSGRVIKVSDATGSGRYLNVIYGADGRIAAVSDHTGRTVQYTYDSSTGVLKTKIDPAGRTTTYGYVSGRFAPLLSDITDNWGRSVRHMTYDSSDRLASYNPKGETLTLTYDTANSIVTQTDSSGVLWKFTYNQMGKITQKTSGSTTLFTSIYNADGTLQQRTDAVGVKTFYTYNADGSVATTIRDYQGSGTGSAPIEFDYGYDPNFPGKVISITPERQEALLITTGKPGILIIIRPEASLRHPFSRLSGREQWIYPRYARDLCLQLSGQVTSISNAAGSITSYGYDPATGDLASVTYPPNADSGSSRTYGFTRDSLGRATAITDPLTHTTVFAYDSLHRVTSITPPPPSSTSTLNFTTTFTYDQTDPNYPGLVFTYRTDPNSKMTKQGVDQFNRPVATIDSQGHVTALSYSKGQLSSITDANGNTTSYTYNTLRSPYQALFPEGNSETYTFRNDGTISSIKKRDNTTVSFTFDHLKRRLTSNSITYTYTGHC